MNEETIFQEALSRSPEERAAFLEQACAGRPDLRAAVEALLAAHAKPGNVLDKPPADLGQTVDSDAGAARPRHTGEYTPQADEPSPQLVPTTDYAPKVEPGLVIAGRYTLAQKIGEGGMGEVWVAKQTEPVKRKVALKLIKTGMDSKAVLARFEQERQALALMDHPNIARVLDGGMTPTGQPFFVMELVNGLPLNKFCDEMKLTPKERLELFVPICQAVQHAHQKGIVHRDLKSANILITVIDARPVPKVIDFGVAKATAGKLTDKSMSTQFGAVVGTLEYMSPEQAGFSGEDIDTRADIYSLGVILYELLTGLKPIDANRLRKAGLTEMIRIIREEEPSKPSTRLSTDESLPSLAALRQTEPKRLMALLRGELDWVVMKCLEKQRERRYETANALARDVQRYLADEAVEARPPSSGYRLKKFLRRNRAAVLTAAVVTVALLSGTAVATWQAIRALSAEGEASRQRDAAITNEQKAKANEQTAQQERNAAQAARDAVRATLYAAEMNLVQSAWEANHIGRVRELLERQIPGHGERDLRRFEWHYWNRLCHTELHTLEGHTNIVTAVAFSPNGRLLASVGGRGANTGPADSTIRVWDSGTGRPVLVLPGPASAVVFTPDDNGLAGALDGAVKVWDLSTGQETRTQILKGLDTRNGRPAFSPDGRRLAARQGATVQVWDTFTGRQLHSFPLPEAESASNLAFSSDGQTLACASTLNGPTPNSAPRRNVRTWDLVTSRQLLAIRARNGFHYDVVFSPDGKRLAAAGETFLTDQKSESMPEVTVWDIADGRQTLSFKGPAGFGGVAFSPDGKRLATFSVDRSVKVWDADTGRELFALKGHTGSVLGVAFSPDSKRLGSAGWDKTVRVWDATIDPQARSFQGHGTAAIRSLVFSPDGTRLASAGGGSESVGVFDPAAGCLIRSPKGLRSAWGVAFSPDGACLAAGGVGALDQAVKVWNTAADKEVLSLVWPQTLVHCLTLSRDGKLLAGGSWSSNPRPGLRGEVKVWDAATGRETHSFKGHDAIITGIAFSPDGRLLASAAGKAPGEWPPDNTVALWDVAAGKKVFSLRGHSDAVWSVAFSPDGERLASASFDGTVKVWDASNGQEVLTLKGHTASVFGVAFSPDGMRLASVSTDQSVKIWDARSGQDLLTLKGHAAWVCSLAFSPDGNRLASADFGGVVKVWDATPVPAKAERNAERALP